MKKRNFSKSPLNSDTLSLDLSTSRSDDGSQTSSSTLFVSRYHPLHYSGFVYITRRTFNPSPSSFLVTFPPSLLLPVPPSFSIGPICYHFLPCKELSDVRLTDIVGLHSTSIIYSFCLKKNWSDTKSPFFVFIS